MAQQHIDRAGIFRARASTWAVRRKEDSKSVCVSFRFELAEIWLDGQWHDWTQYGEWFVYGDWYIVKKDGTLHGQRVEQLVKSLGWNGDLKVIGTQPPPEVMVQIQVKNDPYQGKDRYRADWMNPADHVPGMQGEGEESVKALDAQFGSQLRAIAGASKPKAAPSGKGPPPPPPKAAPVAAPVAVRVSEETPWESDEPADKEADARSRQ